MTHNAHLHQQTFWFSLNFAHELFAVISFRLPMAPGQKKQSLEKDNFWQRRSAKVPGGIETNVILGSGFPIEAAEVKRNPFFIVPLRLRGKCYRTSPWKGVGKILTMTWCASPICSNHATGQTKIAKIGEDGGVRTRSGAIRQTFEEISTQLGKSTSILNRGLFGKRLESISELVPSLGHIGWTQ